MASLPVRESGEASSAAAGGFAAHGTKVPFAAAESERPYPRDLVPESLRFRLQDRSGGLSQ
jgi:hypothetical protein